MDGRITLQSNKERSVLQGRIKFIAREIRRTKSTFMKETQIIKIDIVPLSVNKAWQGKRFKTKLYQHYEMEVLSKLKAMKLPTPPFAIDFIFGFSSPLADLSNPLKLIEDILQKKYKFNDNKIFFETLEKVLVPKGEEFIEFQIREYTPKYVYKPKQK